ncbi:rhomboid family protein, putative, partial [Ichthyophthirius multifiliis]
MRIPFMDFEQSYIDPRKETFWDMIKLNFCPRLKFYSFTVLISLANIIMFIYTSYQGLHITEESKLLEQDQQVLIKYGANVPSLIKNENQLWRFVTAAFLHANFLHIFFNMISTFIFVSSLEHTYGFFTVFYIWILSAIGGNIFSADFATQNSIAVGASTALFGMIGLYLAYLILNWNALRFLEDLRCFVLCMAILIVSMVFLLSSGNSGIMGGEKEQNIDNYGHFGGFITGILAGVAFPKSLEYGSYEKQAKIFC